MKKFGFLMIMGMMSFLWGSSEVTIQVINAVQERSITHAFVQKLKKSGLSIHKNREGNRYVVTLGSYKNEKAAREALKKVRKVVCKEAFVRLVKREETAVAVHTEVKAAVVAVSPKNENVVRVEVKPVVVEVKSAPVSAAICPVDKKEVHKSEMAEAINYYKNSSYHRFEPVMLQP
ncbi:MAG: SPOR domain-containing protein [Sulfuricurvum sp.]|nr:SPOR domain-containing protein [Sulfuricurvum sp.]